RPVVRSLAVTLRIRALLLDAFRIDAEQNRKDPATHEQYRAGNQCNWCEVHPSPPGEDPRVPEGRSKGSFVLDPSGRTTRDPRGARGSPARRSEVGTACARHR